MQLFLIYKPKLNKNLPYRNVLMFLLLPLFLDFKTMVDIFAVTILVALVHLGAIANIEAQKGVVFFAAVVVITMFAAMSFDPRLIWDTKEPEDACEYPA